MDWDEQLREKEPYQGVLYVSRAAIASIAGPADGDILGACLDGEAIHIRWMDGRDTDLTWPALKERSGLAQLRSPHLVFASDGDAIGLLFTSSTPQEGLELVQPHSLIAAIGWLTGKGFEQRP